LKKFFKKKAVLFYVMFLGCNGSLVVERDVMLKIMFIHSQDLYVLKVLFNYSPKLWQIRGLILHKVMF